MKTARMQVKLLFGLLLLGVLATSQAQAQHVPILTISQTAVGHVCDVDDNGLDLFCAGNHPEILADGSISTTGLVVGGTPFSEAGPWQVSGTDVFRNGGRVGIGTATPKSVFHANGDITFSGDWLDVSQSAANSFLIDAGSGKEVHLRGGKNVLTGNVAPERTLSHTLDADGYPTLTNENGAGLLFYYVPTLPYFSIVHLGYQGVEIYARAVSGTSMLKLDAGPGNILLAGGNVGISPISSSIIPTTALEVIGTISATGLVVNGVSITSSGGGDNLGNHTASQTLNLNGNWLSGDGDAEGLPLDANGNAEVSGNISTTGSISTSALQLVGSSGVEACAGADDRGKFRVNPATGKLEICME